MKVSKYAKLDAMIVAEMSADTPTMFNVLLHRPNLKAETEALAESAPRDRYGRKVVAWRILDRRALRKAGKIESSTKGWTLRERDA